MMNSATVIANMQGIPLPPDQLLNQTSMITDNADPTGQSKRRQVKNACTNCQKACKKCDDSRPCPRCVKYGIAETCVSSTRKERKKGVKRGPYKRKEKEDERESSPTPKSYKKKTSNQNESSNNNNTATTSTFTPPSQPPPYINYPAHLTQYHYEGYNNNNSNNGDDQNKLPQNHHYMVGHFAYPAVMTLPPPPHQQQPNENNNNHHPYGPSGLMNQQHPVAPYYISAQHINEYSHLPFSKENHSNNNTNNNNNNNNNNTQPMTPAPSTSTSSTSSPNTQAAEDEPTKMNRLSQLCSAALDNQSSE